jgi:hypothetical protein
VGANLSLLACPRAGITSVRVSDRVANLTSTSTQHSINIASGPEGPYQTMWCKVDPGALFLHAVEVASKR